MDELLARAMQGVDPEMPGAFWQVFFNLLEMMPWAVLFWWNLAFIAIGALLGWWRGRLSEGVLWALVLGPIGWIVILFKPRRATPPRLRR
ncbi:MAG: hypothetical protein ACTS5I_04125 [Rhodanobacter sp.]